LNPGPL